MDETQKGELRELSDDEFMDRWTERAADLDAAKEDCRAFREEHDRRLALERIKNMPEAERAALAQYVRAEGIESLEAVGEQPADEDESEESDNG